MTDTTEPPRVTLAVIAYNQERFIREAIEGAFAQTYQPLEIILSDDCSSDRTGPNPTMGIIAGMSMDGTPQKKRQK